MTYAHIGRTFKTQTFLWKGVCLLTMRGRRERRWWVETEKMKYSGGQGAPITAWRPAFLQRRSRGRQTKLKRKNIKRLGDLTHLWRAPEASNSFCCPEWGGGSVPLAQGALWLERTKETTYEGRQVVKFLFFIWEIKQDESIAFQGLDRSSWIGRERHVGLPFRGSQHRP